MNSPKKASMVIVVVLAVLAGAAFANTVGYGFASDDTILIYPDGPLSDWRLANLTRLFTKGIWAFFIPNDPYVESVPYYRPLFGLLFMIDYRLSGMSPVGWHITALILHVLAVICCYFMVRESLRVNLEERAVPVLAAVAAACFAVHPAQSGTVVLINAYGGQLSAIFIFSSLTLYLRARTAAGRNSYLLFAAVGLYALALLSKEVSIALTIIIFAYELLVLARGVPLRSRLPNTLLMMAPFAVVSVLYMGVRFAIFGAFTSTISAGDSPEPPVTFITNILTLPSMLLRYARIMVWPFELSTMYPLKFVYKADLAGFFLPLTIVAAMALTLLLMARRSPVARVGLIWMIVPILPALDMRAFYAELVIQDRYLYLSMVGAGLLLAAAGSSINARLARSIADREARAAIGWRASVTAVFAAIILIMALAASRQNEVWASDWEIWSRAYEHVPDSFMANLQLGILKEEAGNINEALGHFERARARCPQSFRANFKLAQALERTGNSAGAETALQRILASSEVPTYRALTFLELARIYRQRGDHGRARFCYQQVLAHEAAGEAAQEAARALKELSAR